VNPDEGMEDDPEAASAIAGKHLEVAFARGGDGSVDDFALSLKHAGYVKVSDFRIAMNEDQDKGPV